MNPVANPTQDITADFIDMFTPELHPKNWECTITNSQLVQ